MEPLWNLLQLLEPSSLLLILTAISVTYASANRAFSHGKEMEINRDFSEASITLDRSQALMVPLASSFSLLLMFYLFSSLSLLVTSFITVASASSLFFCLSPYFAYIKSKLGLTDPLVSRCFSKSLTRSQVVFLLLCVGIVFAWLVSGHWLLNNILGISICVAFVSHIRLPNVKICFLLLICLFVYDVFWVFFSELFFGENVMVSVATQKASNPIHTVADSLSLPGLELISQKLEMPVKLIFPKNLMGSLFKSRESVDYMMLGLGDMAIPGMLLSLVLCFDHHKKRELNSPKDGSISNGRGYIVYAVSGYAIGLVAALAAGILTRSPQPALLYLVPSTLGPVMLLSWRRKDLNELWEGPASTSSDKLHLLAA